MEHQVELVFQATRRDGKRLGYVSWAVLVACLDFEVASILFHMGHINWVCQMCRMLLVCQIWNWAGRLWSKDCPASVLYCVSSWSWWSLSSTRERLWIWGGCNMVEFPTSCFKRSTSWRLGWWELSHFSHWIWIICWCEGWSRAKTLNQSGLDEVKIKSCASNELSRTYQMSTLQNYKVCARSDAMIGSFTEDAAVGSFDSKTE